MDETASGAHQTFRGKRWDKAAAYLPRSSGRKAEDAEEPSALIAGDPQRLVELVR